MLKQCATRYVSENPLLSISIWSFKNCCDCTGRIAFLLGVTMMWISSKSGIAPTMFDLKREPHVSRNGGFWQWQHNPFTECIEMFDHLVFVWFSWKKPAYTAYTNWKLYVEWFWHSFLGACEKKAVVRFNTGTSLSGFWLQRNNHEFAWIWAPIDPHVRPFVALHHILFGDVNFER